MSMCLSGTNLSKALNLHLSLIGLSQVSVSFLNYFIVQTEPKIVCLVYQQRTPSWLKVMGGWVGGQCDFRAPWDFV